MIDRENRDDGPYYTLRAREEREKALNCPDVAVARVHQTLADAYEGRVADSRPHLRLVA